MPFFGQPINIFLCVAQVENRVVEIVNLGCSISQDVARMQDSRFTKLIPHFERQILKPFKIVSVKDLNSMSDPLIVKQISEVFLSKL
jgi:hypothetical protein